MCKLFKNQVVSAVMSTLYFLGTLAQAQLRDDVITQPILPKQSGLYEQTIRITNDFPSEQWSPLGACSDSELVALPRLQIWLTPNGAVSSGFPGIPRLDCTSRSAGP